jgi:alanine racemase
MRPLFATIDSGALRHNLGVVRAHAPTAAVLAVIKANAYGHGLERAAAALADAEGFALVELEGALKLRRAGFQKRMAALQRLAADARLDVLLKVNTGMNRLGLSLEEYVRAFERLQRDPRIAGITLMTHFANADDERGVAWQLERLRRLPGHDVLPLTLANSAAILRYPETTRANWVRPGIMLYGSSPFPRHTGIEAGLRPVMTLESRVIAVQDLRPGDTVGYGGLFRAERPTRVGVVACGYADGYPRHAPTGTPVLVAGRMTRTIGRVSMDMLCADLTGLSGIGMGARVVLWGDGLPVERVAEAAGTVSYQLLCALAPRVRIVER